MTDLPVVPIDLMDEIRGHVTRLIAARKAHLITAKARADLIEEFNRRPDVIAAEAAYDATAQEIGEAETSLRGAVVKLYEKTGNKAPMPGLGIRVYSTFEYTVKEATEWAKTHMPVALILDKKEFEKYLARRAEEELPVFVKLIRTPKATISDDKLDAGMVP
jgi:hypothetical protein